MMMHMCTKVVLGKTVHIGWFLERGDTWIQDNQRMILDSVVPWFELEAKHWINHSS
jgi:hypothetical protein